MQVDAARERLFQCSCASRWRNCIDLVMPLEIYIPDLHRREVYAASRDEQARSIDRRGLTSCLAPGR